MARGKKKENKKKYHERASGDLPWPFNEMILRSVISSRWIPRARVTRCRASISHIVTGFPMKPIALPPAFFALCSRLSFGCCLHALFFFSSRRACVGYLILLAVFARRAWKNGVEFMGWFCLDSSRPSFLRWRLVFLQRAWACYGAVFEPVAPEGIVRATRWVYSSTMTLSRICLSVFGWQSGLTFFVVVLD